MDETALDIRRKRVRFRSWHRGTREADLLFGRFADAYVNGMDAPQLERLEALLENSDPDIYAWITGRECVPPEHDHDVMALLQRFTLAASTA